MPLQGQHTRAQFQRASKVIPYGVNSNFRYWGDDDTMVITRGEGTYIWDADGKRYIDYRLGFGPAILGHADPEVNEAVRKAIDVGVVFAWTTPPEIEVAEKICQVGNVEMVRLTNTGTEAAMHALRIARAYTGREKFIKFEGHYHGMADALMFSTASTSPESVGALTNPIAVPNTSGIPKALSQYVHVVPFNHFELLEKAVRANWGDLAAIIVEPIMGNVAAVMPEEGFLDHIRKLCSEYGIVMIMDEVKTGFRVARGGAQEYFGVQSDLVTYAKCLGNGFPIAAIAGKKEVMMTVKPGFAAHGGTYSGNIVGTAAALKTLEILEREPVYDTINHRGSRLMEGIHEILTEADIPHYVSGVPAMFGFILGTDQKPKDFRDYAGGDGGLYEKIAFELVRNGVMPDADGREPWFLCYKLTEEDVDTTLSVLNDAVKHAVR